MNRRGDISITIFVLGVVAICILAILSFYVSVSKMKNSFLGIDTLQEVNSIHEEIRFYENANLLNENFLSYKTEGNLFVIEKEIEQEGEVLFSVQYKFLINKNVYK